MAGAIVSLLAGIVGFSLGEWRHEVRHESGVRCLSAEGAISCELDDGSVIGVPTDVTWDGADGSTRDGDRPACLPPSGRGLEGPVELAWVPVDVDGLGWRQVVWVGC